MKNIYINGRFLTQRVTGVQRFAHEIIVALDNQLNSQLSTYRGKIFLIVPPGDFILPTLNNIKILQRGRLRGHFWEQLELPQFTRDGLLFNPCGPAPLFHPLQVTTVHDASVYAAPAGYSWRFRTWHKLLIWRTGKTARLILTVSSFSKQQLINICRISENKIWITSPSGSHILKQHADAAVLERYDLQGNVRYALCVGSQQANKNMGVVAKAAEILQDHDVIFVIVGSTNLNIYRNRQSSQDKLIFTGYVTDSELRALYEHATCLIFPSFYEGFGIPPLEALTCGCPVIASNTSSIPEVCGSGALYFDPSDATMLSTNVLALLSNAELRDRLKQEGRKQAELYSWEETTRRIVSRLVECATT